MTHDVFISHSSKDKPIADGICANLESAGIRCWIAPRDIAPGEDWPRAIANAISQCRMMVLIFSANANSSDQISRELSMAADYNLAIIPFKIENVEPEPGKQYYLARTHWLDAINPPTQKQINLLIDRVKAFLSPSLQPIPQTIPTVQSKPSEEGIPSLLSSLATAQFSRKPMKRAMVNGFILMAVLIGLGLSVFGIVTRTASGSLPVFPFLHTHTPTPTMNPTATQVPTSTPTIIPTATATPITVWDVDIYDDFTENVSNWPLHEENNSGDVTDSLSLIDGEMVWNIKANAPTEQLIYPKIGPFSDFDMSIDVQFVKGQGSNDSGLGFQYQKGYYVFSLLQNDRWFTIGSWTDNWRNIVDWTYVSGIKTVGVNRLGVSARGPYFTFYINGTKVAETVITDLSSGMVGLDINMRNTGDTMLLRYDNFELHGNR